MNRDRSGSGSGDGMANPDLEGLGDPTNGMVTRGLMHERQSNPTQRTGRPDGTVHPQLTDADGFDADDPQASGSWRGPTMGEGDPSVSRAGRPEITGQLERGYVWDEAAAAMQTTKITDPRVNPGGHIGPA